jgi:hypothetical protein
MWPYLHGVHKYICVWRYICVCVCEGTCVYVTCASMWLCGGSVVGVKHFSKGYGMLDREKWHDTLEEGLECISSHKVRRVGQDPGVLGF